MTNDSAIHLVLRYANKGVDTISEHQAILDENGSVWFGKLGKALAQRHIARLNEQCEAKINTYVYLVLSAGKRSLVHKCRLVRVSDALSRDELKLVPEYYKDQNNILRYVVLWLSISDFVLVDRKTLAGFRVAATGTKILEALGTSTSGQFIVTEG